MHTYKSIAVGTDGSATSMVAVRAAASLARVYGAELTIICAHYTASGSMLNSTNAREILRKADEIAKEEQAGKVNLVSQGGQPANVLVEAVGEYGVDLLVVGNKGMRSMAGRIFGNIPGNVAKKAPVDVMLVDTRAEGHD